MIHVLQCHQYMIQLLEAGRLSEKENGCISDLNSASPDCFWANIQYFHYALTSQTVCGIPERENRLVSVLGKIPHNVVFVF